MIDINKIRQIAPKIDAELLYDMANTRFGTNLEHKPSGAEGNTRTPSIAMDNSNPNVTETPARESEVATKNVNLNITTDVNGDTYARTIARSKEANQAVMDGFFNNVP